MYLRGHAGDTIRVDRVGREPVLVEDPALTLALTVQPEVLRQLGDSYYVGVFQVPRLPETLARRGVVDRATRRLSRRSDPTARTDYSWRTAADAEDGLELYRANMGRGAGTASPQRISIPLQVLAPAADAHVTVAMQTEAPRPFVRDLRVEVIEGGHWVVAQRPALVADRVDRFISSLDLAPVAVAPIQP